MSFDVVHVEYLICGEPWLKAVIQPTVQVVSSQDNVFFQPQPFFQDLYA
jgi:hypothetical protein